MDIYFKNVNENYCKNSVKVGVEDGKYRQSPNGDTIDVNQRYMIKNGYPIIPVMGELHYSRYACDEWEKEIIKMKRGGVNIIASYCFWIHHEEEEGEFNFTENKNIRRFIELCHKHDLFCWMRIGPWNTGECRNGGYPDWLVYKEGRDKPILKKVPDAHLHYLKRLYREYSKQMEGLYFYQGGPIVGIQLDNEYRFEPSYLVKLKEIAIEEKILVPIYSITGWGSSEVPKEGLQPVFGAYPAAPWTQNTKKLPPMKSYMYSKIRSNDMIDMDYEIVSERKYKADILDQFPYFTCETGTGIQETWHRRPLILPDDSVAVSYCLLGSGSNLPGYYMYHGGTNPVGKKGEPMSCSKLTNMNNDCPELSYDFQAALGEFGQVREQYHKLRFLHSFLKYWGVELAQMSTILPDLRPTNESDFSIVRSAFRGNGESGFIFYNNYIRGYEETEFKDVSWTIDNGGEKLNVPKEPIAIKKGCYGFLPVNLKIKTTKNENADKEIKLVYSLVQPLIKSKNHIFFLRKEGLEMEFVFSGHKEISDILNNIEVYKNSNQTIVNCKNCSYDPLFAIDDTYFHVVDEDMAKNIYDIDNENIIITDEIFYDEISNGSVILNFESEKENIEFFTYKNMLRSLNNPIKVSEFRNKYEIKTNNKPYFKKVIFEYIGDVSNVKVYKDSQTDHMDKKYKVELSDDIFVNNPSLVMLNIEYVGSMAELYIDDVRLADDFYNGNRWLVNLMRFKDEILKGNELNILVKALSKEQDIYFDTTIEFEDDGHICKLNEIEIKKYYESKICLDEKEQD